MTASGCHTILIVSFGVCTSLGSEYAASARNRSLPHLDDLQYLPSIVPSRTQLIASCCILQVKRFQVKRSQGSFSILATSSFLLLVVRSSILAPSSDALATGSISSEAKIQNSLGHSSYFCSALSPQFRSHLSSPSHAAIKHGNRYFCEKYLFISQEASDVVGLKVKMNGSSMQLTSTWFQY